MTRGRFDRPKRRRFDAFHLFVAMWLLVIAALVFVGIRQTILFDELNQVHDVQLPTLVER